MHLPEQDIALFYKLHPAVVVYANRQLGIVSGASTAKELLSVPVEKRLEVQDALCDHVELFDAFADENPSGFSAEGLAIVRSWKHLLRGRFLLLRYLKQHAIFLSTGSPAKAYGVCALGDSFEELIPRFALPVMVQAVLLPFKGRIVYDGLLQSYRVSFGGGMRRGFKESYDDAKARFGIITSLPHVPQESRRNEAERLKLYLKSKSSRERHWDEIHEMIGRDPELLVLYHQEMGKAHARRQGTRLREMGVTDAWFAILEGTIVASGKTKEEAERAVRVVLPPERTAHPHLFQVKAKKGRS